MPALAGVRADRQVALGDRLGPPSSRFRTSAAGRPGRCASRGRARAYTCLGRREEQPLAAGVGVAGQAGQHLVGSSAGVSAGSRVTIRVLFASRPDSTGPALRASARLTSRGRSARRRSNVNRPSQTIIPSPPSRAADLAPEANLGFVVVERFQLRLQRFGGQRVVVRRGSWRPRRRPASGRRPRRLFRAEARQRQRVAGDLHQVQLGPHQRPARRDDHAPRAGSATSSATSGRSSEASPTSPLAAARPTTRRAARRGEPSASRLTIRSAKSSRASIFSGSGLASPSGPPRRPRPGTRLGLQLDQDPRRPRGRLLAQRDRHPPPDPRGRPKAPGRSPSTVIRAILSPSIRVGCPNSRRPSLAATLIKTRRRASISPAANSSGNNCRSGVTHPHLRVLSVARLAVDPRGSAFAGSRDPAEPGPGVGPRENRESRPFPGWVGRRGIRIRSGRGRPRMRRVV